MGGETIDVIMDELDIADRSLARLLGFYDRKNTQGFLSAEEQAQSEPYRKGASMIVPLIEAGGNEGTKSTVNYPGAKEIIECEMAHGLIKESTTCRFTKTKRKRRWRTCYAGVFWGRSGNRNCRSPRIGK
jgi:hypothetical protein